MGGGHHRLCQADDCVLMLGPMALLSPLSYEHWLDLIAGTQAIDPVEALTVASQWANFRQMRGVRLVTMTKHR